MAEGRLEGIWIKRARRGPMDPVVLATLVPGRGLAGNADQGGRRQVSILQAEVWDELALELRAALDPSVRRANLLVRGVALRGSRGLGLRIGACMVRVGGELTPCERMEEAWPGLQEALRPNWRGGVFGEVIAGGEVHVGDPVTLLALGSI
jgi:MOSC domain-containing protein YiiM